LIVKFDDLQAGLVAVGLRVVVPQPQAALAGDRTLPPELLDCPVIEGSPERAGQDPRQFPIVERVIERLEPINLQPDGFGGNVLIQLMM
jgi:hypothetical protein